MDDNNLESPQYNYMTQLVSGNIHLQNLSLKRCNIGNDGCKSLAEGLEKNKTLQVVSLYLLFISALVEFK